MRLKGFTVHNFRSITEAHKLPVDEKCTVLIGKNNEGKSNVLKALNLAFNILFVKSKVNDDKRVFEIITRYSSYRGRKDDDDFVWERDYPISKQKQKKCAPVKLRLDFLLDEDEQKDFKKLTSKRINEDLPIQIEIRKDNLKFNIPKKAHGKTAHEYTEKIKEIIGLILSKIEFIYIPAIRPPELSMNIIERLIEKEFENRAKESDSYQQAKLLVQNFTSTVYQNVSGQIKKQLSAFVDVKDIKILDLNTSGNDFFKQRRHNEYDIKINDGVETSLYQKGDGIKSLIALSLIRTLHKEDNVFLAIEEPETHLHPGAIKKIKEIIEDISDINQVIISTHSPLLVSRDKLESNIIVTNKKAKKVLKTSEIRNELGIDISDNLINAELMLLVEGETDKVALTSLLERESSEIKKAFQSGKLAICNLQGAPNLSYQLSLYKNLLCKVICLLDNDDEAIKAVKKAIDNNILKDSEYIICSIKGCSESELEDMYDDSIYSEYLQKNYDILLPKDFWSKPEKKWSDRMKQVFLNAGKLWDEKKKEEIKKKVAELVKMNLSIALNEHRRLPFDNLKQKLEQLVNKEHNDTK